jgi:predicted N-formylglutamate amidohydrolase
MSQNLLAPLIINEYSMELIDVTRSLHHRSLFPPLTRSWSAADRQQLIDQIHAPYRQQIRAGIEQLLSQYAYVVHLSIRSFPLRQSGKIRRADVGLLYDPARDDEVDLCLDWIDEMYELIPMLRVRRNYPRRGTTDSITKSMRTEFAGRSYVGIEVLLNRAWAGRPLAIRDEVIDQMCGCLQRVLARPQSEAA